MVSRDSLGTGSVARAALDKKGVNIKTLIYELKRVGCKVEDCNYNNSTESGLTGPRCGAQLI